MTRKRQLRQRAYFASLAQGEAAAADDETATVTGSGTGSRTGSLSTATSASRASHHREKDDAQLFRTSVRLTATAPARSCNPFLGGSARGDYVGSHLGSKLSNITSLFGEETPSKPVIEGTPAKKQKRSRSRTAAPPFAVRETPARRRTVEETPLPKKQHSRARLRPRDDNPYAGGTSTAAETPQQSNSIVAETPQHHHRHQQQQDPPARGGVGRLDRAASSVIPTNLWRMQDAAGAASAQVRPRSRQSLNLSGSGHRPQDHRKRKQHRSSRGGTEHLSPIVNTFSAIGSLVPSSLSLGLSPMPHQEDMASVMAKAAKAYRRKKK